MRGCASSASEGLVKWRKVIVGRVGKIGNLETIDAGRLWWGGILLGQGELGQKRKIQTPIPEKKKRFFFFLGRDLLKEN